jgi:hypothetical protein
MLCRGTVIGILKAFLGLSGSFFTTIYVSFIEPDAVSFLLMLAVIPAAVVLACTFFVNYVPYIQIEPHTKVPRALPLTPENQLPPHVISCPLDMLCSCVRNEYFRLGLVICHSVTAY